MIWGPFADHPKRNDFSYLPRKRVDLQIAPPFCGLCEGRERSSLRLRVILHRTLPNRKGLFSAHFDEFPRGAGSSGSPPLLFCSPGLLLAVSFSSNRIPFDPFSHEIFSDVPSNVPGSGYTVAPFSLRFFRKPHTSLDLDVCFASDGSILSVSLCRQSKLFSHWKIRFCRISDISQSF